VAILRRLQESEARSYVNTHGVFRSICSYDWGRITKKSRFNSVVSGALPRVTPGDVQERMYECVVEGPARCALYHRCVRACAVKNVVNTHYRAIVGVFTLLATSLSGSDEFSVQAQELRDFANTAKIMIPASESESDEAGFTERDLDMTFIAVRLLSYAPAAHVSNAHAGAAGKR
jgi:hypothetical protein